MAHLIDTSVTFRTAHRRTYGWRAILETWIQRQHLRRLDDAALADIGVTRLQAVQEAARPIWDIPAQ